MLKIVEQRNVPTMRAGICHALILTECSEIRTHSCQEALDARPSVRACITLFYYQIRQIQGAECTALLEYSKDLNITYLRSE